MKCDSICLSFCYENGDNVIKNTQWPRKKNKITVLPDDLSDWRRKLSLKCKLVSYKKKWPTM